MYKEKIFTIETEDIIKHLQTLNEFTSEYLRKKFTVKNLFSAIVAVNFTSCLVIDLKKDF